MNDETSKVSRNFLESCYVPKFLETPTIHACRVSDLAGTATEIAVVLSKRRLNISRSSCLYQAVDVQLVKCGPYSGTRNHTARLNILITRFGPEYLTFLQERCQVVVGAVFWKDYISAAHAWFGTEWSDAVAYPENCSVRISAVCARQAVHVLAGVCFIQLRIEITPCSWRRHLLVVPSNQCTFLSVKLIIVLY